MVRKVIITVGGILLIAGGATVLATLSDDLTLLIIGIALIFAGGITTIFGRWNL